jgi:hypothetical protein
MDDKAFNELKLRASIIPTQPEWPKPEVIHWMRLHECADKARDLVKLAHAAMDAVDANPDLSPQGKARQSRKVGAEAILALQNANDLERARKAVAHQMQQWQAKIGLALKPPADAPEAILHWEIRDRFVALRDERERMSFLERFAGDAQIASALLTGPAGLTNLSDAERAMLKVKLESHTPSEIIAARDATAKALQEVEAGWKRAQDVIGQRAGLTKGADGTWGQPADANAAA